MKYLDEKRERIVEMIIDKVKKLCSDTVTSLNKLCQGYKYIDTSLDINYK